MYSMSSLWHQAKLPVKHGGIGVLSASALPAFLASVLISKTSTIIIDATWWHQRHQLQILGLYGHMAVDHQDTNIRFVDRCQSENMMSSSTAYRHWSGIVCCPNSGKPSSPYCGCSTIFWSVPIQVIPISSVDTRLDNTSMLIAVSLHLGAPLYTPRITVSLEWLSI